MKVHIDSADIVHAAAALDDRTICGDALEEDLNGVPFLDAEDIGISCETCCRIIRHCKSIPAKMLRY